MPKEYGYTPQQHKSRAEDRRAAKDWLAAHKNEAKRVRDTHASTTELDAVVAALSHAGLHPREIAAKLQISWPRTQQSRQRLIQEGRVKPVMYKGFPE